MRTTLLILTMCALTVSAQAQSTERRAVQFFDICTTGSDNSNKLRNYSTERGDSDLTTYWSEDFSEGLNGQGSNGAWTVGGVNADLWFHTFPVGAENGYDAEMALPPEHQDAYGLYIPNWASEYEITLQSPTAENGYMMIDVDRFNSTAMEGQPTGNTTATNNPVSTFIESPSINLTGIENAIVTFYQDWRLCCENYNLALQFSVDGGQSWELFDLFELNNGFGNERETGQGVINISNLLAGADDLSDCRMRFAWDPALLGTMSQYYFVLDDIAISAVPENDLAIGTAWYNKWFDLVDEVPDVEYVKHLEYEIENAYFTRPFNFGCEVFNLGSEIQSGVRLKAIVNSFDESIDPEVFYSNPIDLNPGSTDTLRIFDVLPIMWYSPQESEYIINFEVVQNEDDQRPFDNVSHDKRIILSFPDYGGGVVQNGGFEITNYPTIGQNVIWGNRFEFYDSANSFIISHIEFVIQSNEHVQTEEGALCFINVRKGSVLEPESEDNNMEDFYQNILTDFIVTEDLISTDESGVNWISYELPFPILIQPNTIYQAEVIIPDTIDGNVFIGMSNHQEPNSSVYFDPTNLSDGPQGWWALEEGLSPMIRLRIKTASGALSVNNLSYQSGVKLVQNYPNPFQNNTTIQYQLDKTSEVFFEVHNVSGKLIHSENLGIIPAMSTEFHDFNSKNLASGIYTYSIVAGENRVSRKMVVE